MISNGTVVISSRYSLRLPSSAHRQLLQQGVGFAIENTVALLDNGVSDGLCAVTFPAPRRTKKQGIFPLSDPVRCGQFEDQVAIHPGIELEVEVVQALVGIAELRLFVASLQDRLLRHGCECVPEFVKVELLATRSNRADVAA